MLNLNLPAINLDAEQDGVWVRYNETISFKIARHNNKNYIKALLEAKDSTVEDISNDDAERLMADVYSKTILVDWEGVEDDEKPIQYSPEIGRKLLLDERYKEVISFIDVKSKSANNYYEKVVKEQGKD